MKVKLIQWNVIKWNHLREYSEKQKWHTVTLLKIADFLRPTGEKKKQTVSLFVTSMWSSENHS